MKALFITRAQPFHKGHLHAIKKAMEKFEVIIGIGSSNESNTFKNPFSFEERVEMIRRAGVNCKIVPIPDVGNDKKWTEEVLRLVDFDVVISGNPWVRKCFSGIKPVVFPDFLEKRKYNGTKIREKMARGEKWEHLVHPEVARYIKEIRGEERVRKLAYKV